MLEKYNDQLEFNRPGIISMLLIIVTCFAGVAAATALNYLPLVMLIVASTMAVESFILSVQSMKWIIRLSVVSLLISILTILFF
jgi:hypothetical protein